MSVVYPSWEVASGPTVACKVGAQGNTFLNESASYRLHTQQDAVVYGLSALSLCVQPHTEVNISPRDIRCDNEPAFLGNESGAFALNSARNGVSLIAEEHVCRAEQPVQPYTFLHSARVRSDPPLNCYDEFNRSNRYNDSLWPPFHSSTLDAVSEDRPWEEQSPGIELGADSLSSSSMSATQVESFGSSEDSQALDDSEAQSSYCGLVDPSNSSEAPLPPRKGLSRFYIGKSRSFSCLRDVTSVKDLAKPENLYARKRKSPLGSNGSFERPRLLPVRNGASGISKKSSNSSKCTLALAVVMGTTSDLPDSDEQDLFSTSAGRLHSSSAPCRSYSLSDLQRASGNRFSPS